MNNRIGVFDSGLGGLTVLKELFARFPADYFYIADTAHLPYGSKSPEQIIQFSHQIVAYFDQQHIKTCIVACHTASTIALDALRKSFAHMNIIGVAQQVCQMAVKKTQKKSIGILATAATIASHGHKNYIKHLSYDMNVIEQACPELVPAIEAQNFNVSLIKELITHYLDPMLDQNVDTIILGSTHYALIKDLIQKYVGPTIFLASAESTVNLLGTHADRPDTFSTLTVHTTSEPQLFWQRAHNLIGLELPPITLVSF